MATKLGMDPNKTAGLAAHAGHFGNFAGFTHPTQVAVVATAAIGFGAINVVGAITGISIIAFSWYRIVREMRKNPPIISQDIKDEVARSLSNKSGISFSLAIFPFLLFCIGFVLGIPVFVDGTVCAILVAILAKMNPRKSETDMIDGVKRASIPIVATISFLFMSGVINKIGLVDVISNIMAPLVSISPVYTMLFVSALAGFITQSNAASVAIDVPFCRLSLLLVLIL